MTSSRSHLDAYGSTMATKSTFTTGGSTRPSTTGITKSMATAVSSSKNPSSIGTSKSTLNAARSFKHPSTTGTAKSTLSAASSPKNPPTTSTNRPATFTAGSSSKNSLTTGTAKSTTSAAALSSKKSPYTGTIKPTTATAASSFKNSSFTGTNKPTTFTAASSSKNPPFTGTTKSTTFAAASSSKNLSTTGITKSTTLTAAPSSNRSTTGTTESTTSIVASSSKNRSTTGTSKSTTLTAAPSSQNHFTTGTKSIGSSSKNPSPTFTNKSTVTAKSSQNPSTTGTKSTGSFSKDPSPTFTNKPTVTALSSQNTSTTGATTHLNSQVSHHMQNTSDITPYFLTVPTTRPYQVTPYYEGLWQRGSPFSLAEENLQYMTFLYDQWQDGLAVAVGGWDDDNGGIMDKTKSEGSKSGPPTPPRNQAPRKKITLSAYKRKRAGESGETTPSLGGGDLPPAKKARTSPPPLQPAPTKTPPPPPPTLAPVAVPPPAPTATPTAPPKPTLPPTNPDKGLSHNLPPLLSPTLPTSIEEELAKERGSSASQPSRKAKVLKLRIPRRLQKTVARLLQTKPQPKRPETSAPPPAAVAGAKRPRPNEDETARDPPSKRPRAPHGTDLPHQPRTPIPPLEFPSLKSQSSHLGSAVAAVVLRRPRSGDGDVMTPSAPAAARSGTPTAPPSAEKPKPTFLNASSSSSTTTATTTRQEESAALRADHKKYLALGRDLKHVADALLKPKEPSAATTSNSSDATNRGIAIALECVLCYMLAFALADEASHLARYPSGDASSWRSILPYWAFVESKCQQHPQSPLLYGLVLQLGAVCRDVIHSHDLDRLASEPVPTGEELADFKSRLVDNARVARTLWQEGTSRLSVNAFQEHFPSTWERRTAVPAVGRVRLEPGAYGGDFYLPLSGGVSSAVEAVRVGCAVLGEWCAREKVKWEGRLGL